MDINFNGTIIALFGSLPLETLDSQGGTGFAPSSLDFFFFKAERVQLWLWGREERRGEGGYGEMGSRGGLYLPITELGL